MKLAPRAWGLLWIQEVSKGPTAEPINLTWQVGECYSTCVLKGPHRNVVASGLLFAFYFNFAPAQKLTNKKQQGKVESWEFHRLPVRESHKQNKLQVTFMHIFLYFFPKIPLSCLFSPDSIWPWWIQPHLQDAMAWMLSVCAFVKGAAVKQRGFKYSWVMPKSSKH